MKRMTTKIIPQNGDRIIIKNIPENYQYADLYKTNGEFIGTVEDHFDLIKEKGYVSFFTGYIPYKRKDENKEKISCSGCGNGCDLRNLKFLYRKPAKFWQFKENIWKANNSEIYEEEVSFFEIEFNKLK